MKEISVEETKCIQINILKNVTEFCDKENIRYFLCGGTLLGAVRHKGYIPWDDDIDISMPRPDYLRFIKEYNNNRYKKFCWSVEENCLCPYLKVYDSKTKVVENYDWGENLGINIDIFPIDGLPKKEKNIKHWINFMKISSALQVCAVIKDYSQRNKKQRIMIGIMKFIYWFVPIQKYLTGCTIKFAQRYSFNTSDFVACVVWGYGQKEVMHRKTASMYVKAPFEKIMFDIPVDYDTYLKSLYGDYMKLPPEWDRILKHDLKMYWI